MRLTITTLLPVLGLAHSAAAQNFQLHNALPQAQAAFNGLLDGLESGGFEKPLSSAVPHAEFPVDVAGDGEVGTAECTPYWLETIKHQGVSAFNSDASYVVFRNVKDYGAKGDGVTDDTAAINAAISAGNRCGPANCQSSTTTPAIVYFPAGTYIVSTSIIDYYYTQIIGNPNCLPTIKATAGFKGFGIIDGDQYQNSGNLGFGSTNVFYRQIRNFILDTTDIPDSTSALAIHWPTAQATSLQNIVFRMSSNSGTQHQGIFMESGSGGFMTDLVFYGGLNGVVFGNQQFTMRNLSFYNAGTAIDQIWDWGWTYKGITINNCSVGVNMNAGGRTGQNVGSVTLIDSTITNTPIGVQTAHDNSSSPATAGGLIIENVIFNNVQTIVNGPNGTVLSGTSGSTTINGWGEGHTYTGTSGPANFEGAIKGNTRPDALTTSAGRYYARSKPQYASLNSSQVYSARQFGATGDGNTDDTAALQSAITSAATNNRLLFVDAGTYKVTNTIYFPAGLKITGEAYSVIMSSGSLFTNINAPAPVIRVGNAGEKGSMEWSNMIVSTQGAQAGAVLIEWNLASPSYDPSGMWDVHTRIGGFAGSSLQASQCPTTPSTATPPGPINSACIAAYMSMHVTPAATGLYLENTWFWTADHDIDSASLTQTTIYAGRGVLIESSLGTVWLVGTAVEHHALYQYQLANTRNVFAGQVQTETPYYQPNPGAPSGFATNASIFDPVFGSGGEGGNLTDAWGLRVLNSTGVLVYGAGLYSFFDNYSTNCSNAPGGSCQSRIFSIEGAATDMSVYNLNTVGVTDLISRDGVAFANYLDNLNVYPDSVALYRTG